MLKKEEYKKNRHKEPTANLSKNKNTLKASPILDRTTKRVGNQEQQQIQTVPKHGGKI
jgi:hypothetical protein